MKKSDLKPTADILDFLELEVSASNSGAFADAIIDYLDANWCSCSCAERSELIGRAERFHSKAKREGMD